jgi:hypothetical protein
MIDPGDKAFGGFVTGQLGGDPWPKADLEDAIVRLDVEQRNRPLGIEEISICHTSANQCSEETTRVAKLFCQKASNPLLHNNSPFPGVERPRLLAAFIAIELLQ